MKNVLLQTFVVVVFTAGAVLFTNGGDRVYAYSQSLDNITSGSAVTCGLQFLGAGVSASLSSLTIKVVNDGGGNVPVNNGAFQIVEYDTSAYTCVYPCSLNKRSPDSFAVTPSARYSGGNITSGSGVVTIRAVWTNTSMTPDHYYTVGYTGTNAGNNLKIVGTDVDVYAGGVFRYSTGDGGNYCRVDQPQTYSHTGLLADMYFSIDDAVEPTTILSGTEPADLTDQTIKLDLAGTMQVAEHQRLDILAWSECSRSGYASYKSITPDATIQFFSNDCQTETIDKGSGYYTGAGWCFSPYNPAWTATGIKVPFPNNYTCQYPISYNLYSWDSDHNRYILTASGDITVLSPITSGSGASANCDGLGTAEYIACKIKTTLTDVFGFNNIDTSTVNVLSDELKTKAPFAYGMAVFNFNMSAPLSSTSLPALSLVFATSSPTYNWTGGGVGIDSAFTTIRTALSIFLWVFLVSYIVLRIRSFSEKL
jgi:hypothetical protein